MNGHQPIVNRIHKYTRELNEALKDANKAGLQTDVRTRKFHDLVANLTLVNVQVFEVLDAEETEA